jgi:hypothetical protein
MQAVSRIAGTGRLFRYICSAYWNRGTTVCDNGRMVLMATADAAIRTLLATEVLQPARLEAAFDQAIAVLHAATGNQLAHQTRAATRLREVERTLANLTETAAQGGAVPAVLEALNRADAERRGLQQEMAGFGDRDKSALSVATDAASLRRTLRGYVDQWHALIMGNVQESRRLFDLVLRDRIQFRPVDGTNGPSYELTVPIAFDRLLVSVIPSLQVRVASPAGFDPILCHDPRTIIQAA